MVSRRNFAAITVVMAIIFFLFQFLNMAKEYWNDYQTNAYEVDLQELPDQSSVYTIKKQSEDKQDSTDSDNSAGQNAVVRQPAVCIGSSDAGSVGEMLSYWGLYTKREVDVYESLAAYEQAIKNNEQETPQFLLIDPDAINWSGRAETLKLQRYVDQGINLIFSRIPDVSVISGNFALRTLLGIDSIVEESTTVVGVHLYRGLLLGGEKIYQAENEKDQKNQDLELTFPWYHLTEGTKVYMKGITADESIDVQEHPVLIWRKSFGTAFVFAVNGTYMQGAAGLGYLTGMLCEMQSDTIYPVVNAQNLVGVNYPGMANENEEVLQQMYSQSMRGVFRDVIWPAFASVSEKTKFEMTAMMAPQMDYTDDILPQSEDLRYYMEVVNEQNGEMGISGDTEAKNGIQEKWEADAEFLGTELPSYHFSSLYRGNLTEEELSESLTEDLLKQVRTVVEDPDDSSGLIGYLTDSVTRQKTVIDGYEHTYSQDLLVRSIETALGYSSVLVDIGRVVYPQSDEDAWEKLSEKLMANLTTYWKPFRAFDGTTVSECDTRIRSFLAMNYQEIKTDDTIILDITGRYESCWFILKTYGKKITETDGGSAVKIEDDAWLVRADADHVSISLEPENQRYYYELPKAETETDAE